MHAGSGGSRQSVVWGSIKEENIGVGGAREGEDWLTFTFQRLVLWFCSNRRTKVGKTHRLRGFRRPAAGPRRMKTRVVLPAGEK